jgi:hypothetical protein
MRAATVTRKPSGRAFDPRNKRVTVSLGERVETVFGRGEIVKIMDNGFALLFVRISDPGQAEHGRVVVVRTIR